MKTCGVKTQNGDGLTAWQFGRFSQGYPDVYCFDTFFHTQSTFLSITIDFTQSIQMPSFNC